MKTLNEIKEEVAKNNGYMSWSNVYHLMLNGGIGLAYYTRLWEVISIQYAEQALDEAADKSKDMWYESEDSSNTEELRLRNFQACYATAKQTILSIKEQLK